MGWIKETIKNILQNGIRIGYSTGKPFDPTDQERTDPIDDIMKKDEEHDKEMLDKMFQPVKKKNKKAKGNKDD